MLDSAAVHADTLRLAIHHRGGCAPHDFGLVVSSTFRESHPVQTPAFLAHDGHGEMCDASIPLTVRADLSPIATEWRRAHQADTGTIILQLSVGDSTEIPVRYVF